MGLSFSTSWVALCNQALGRLDKGAIADLDEGSQNANYCSLYLGQAIEEIYAYFDWSMRTRMQLARLVATPVFGPAYFYQLPSDFISLISIDTDENDYSIESDRVATDAEEVFIVYLAQPTDPSKIPAYIRKAISTRLAKILALPLTSSETLTARLLQEDSQALADAVAADARKTQAEDPEPWYDEAR